VSPVLISRFKEREESVRVDILQTFTELIRVTGIGRGYASKNEVSRKKRRTTAGISEQGNSR